jgi:transcription initiation factor IIF auxiliary subunit
MAMISEDTLIKITAKNTSRRITSHSSEQELFAWSIFIETEPWSFRKEIDKVTYHLHPTFLNKDVAITTERNGFRLDAQGWGEFMIQIEIRLRDGRMTIIPHYLSLFSDDKKKETTKTMYKLDFSKIDRQNNNRKRSVSF